MLPLILTPHLRVGLAGTGPAHARRAAMLAEAGVRPLAVAPDGEVAGLHVLFIAGLDDPAPLAGRARAAGVLVNVEDVPALCDVHVPASVRRGDLLLTASTGGKAPGLSRLLRAWLERRLPSVWSERLIEADRLRRRWREQGLPPAAVFERLAVHAGEERWLP